VTGGSKAINFPGTPRYNATAFSIGNSLYVMMGKANSGMLKDVYELKISN
jgi:N-acetylneuraminic acid mutarotase